MCHNCFQHEETLQHLLASCPLANQIWEKISFRCQKRCRADDDIISTLRLWPKSPYNCELLNHLWRIIPGIALWNIWKERNKRIFKNVSSRFEEIWHRIQENLHETMMLRTWPKEDYPSTDNERNILNNWQLQLPQADNKQRSSSSSSTADSCWNPPPNNSFKLNFDGASKGNPGAAGFGGILRNHVGTPLQVYFGNMGWDTNNSAELEGLWQGLLLADQLNLQPLIVEGDSQLLINIATHLQNGSQARKIAPSWRLEARLNIMEQFLRNKKAISFNHTRREGNKIADLLANVGVENNQVIRSGSMAIIQNQQQAQELNCLIQKDAGHSDAGDGTGVMARPHGQRELPRASPWRDETHYEGEINEGALAPFRNDIYGGRR